ncbi:hypothetical protein DSO57_1000623 [Entomophthora muscae]|uniref:Uncharacterized protein n=1 Tax=Entomophthora muscae TaxID=34485 RepID=A0ACC2S0F8_9FUNG|nr:hypothetical protein DSO57_1000623 [Entomophthora muscae]
MEEASDSVRAGEPRNLTTRVESAPSPVKQKRRQPRNPTGGIEPHLNHQGRCNKATRASLLTGPGGLTAPNGSGATSSNATNEPGGSHLVVSNIYWVIQKIQYQLGLLNNLENTPVHTQLFSSSELKTFAPNIHSPSSPDPSANTQSNLNENTSTPTDVIKYHLQEVDPDSTPNHIKPVEEESQANATPTSPRVYNYFIGSRSEEELLSQEYSPSNDNPSAHKQVQTVKQPQPQMIELGIISHQSASSNLANSKVKPDVPNQVPSTAPSHELTNQYNGPEPVNFPFPTQSKIIGVLSPVLKNSSPSPKLPMTKGWVTRVHQEAASSHFQRRPDEWYKTPFPTIKSDTDNI